MVVTSDAFTVQRFSRQSDCTPAYAKRARSATVIISPISIDTDGGDLWRWEGSAIVSGTVGKELLEILMATHWDRLTIRGLANIAGHESARRAFRVAVGGAARDIARVWVVDDLTFCVSDELDLQLLRLCLTLACQDPRS